MEKPIKCATIPETFDETKHYIEQLPPVDMGDYIWVDVVVKDLAIEDSPVEPESPVPSEPYVPEPTLEERDKKKDALDKIQADAEKATTVAKLQAAVLDLIKQLQN